LISCGGDTQVADIREITMNVGIISVVEMFRDDRRYDVHTAKDKYNNIILKLNRYIVEDHQKNITISYPKGWWQALKKDYLTGIANYFPVKMVNKVIEAKIYYPNIAIPKENAYVKFRRYEHVSEFHNQQRSSVSEKEQSEDA
jgi:hypothetical protein